MDIFNIEEKEKATERSLMKKKEGHKNKSWQ
jgi:hypothetical protein